MAKSQWFPTNQGRTTIMGGDNGFSPRTEGVSLRLHRTQFAMGWKATSGGQRLQWRFFSYGRLAISESQLQFPTSYIPGGTCIGVNDKWTTRVIEQGADPSGQGRWSYVKIGGQAIDVMLISAYRVCQKAGATVGPLTAYLQQWTMSREEGNQNPDPRHNVITDLLQFIREQ